LTKCHAAPLLARIEEGIGITWGLYYKTFYSRN
jgi:hypothetical protein